MDMIVDWMIDYIIMPFCIVLILLFIFVGTPWFIYVCYQDYHTSGGTFILNSENWKCTKSDTAMMGVYRSKGNYHNELVTYCTEYKLNVDKSNKAS